MKSPLLIALAWLATVALAFMLGGKLRPEASARGDQRPAAEPRAAMAPEAPSQTQPQEARAADETVAKPVSAPAAAPEPVKPLVIEPGMQPGDLSTLLMRYVEKQLARGPEGHKELFRELDRLMRDKGLQQMLRDESQLMPHLYPWVKFLVDHDKQVVAMMETIYKTGAEDPQWFQGLDDEPMEMFAEGLAVLLPGVADEEQLARFRAYAEKIVAMPKESLPEALAKNLNDIQRDLEWWSPALTPEQIVQALNDPSQSVATKISLLRRANPASLVGVDVGAILAAALREGNPQSIWLVQRYADTVSTPALDSAFLDGVATGRLEWHVVSSYASVTQRTTWETLKPFLETGLARGGKATEAFAQSLMFFQKQVPKEFVAGVLASYALSDQIRTQLRKQYGIE